MRKIVLILLVFISTSIFSSVEYIKRYAIVIGCNYGDETTEKLEYAVSDAENFSKVLVDLGGTEADNINLLRNPKIEDVKKSINNLRGALAISEKLEKERSEVIFYYSGHSNKKGLILYNDNYYFENLKDDLNSLDSEVKIVVLDSCYSGEFTRFKGGIRKPPFIFDTSNETEGRAILTSSTGDEQSQESDLYESSFFSHALITGLRGVADSNNDKKVTLNEAYQYAFDETLKKTEDKGQITQHPAYDIELKGTGNLVMTDLESQSSKLLLTEEFYGNVSLRKANGVLVAEFFKRAGDVIELCINSGEYKITIIQGEKKFTDDFKINENQKISSDELDLKKKNPIFAIFKGEKKFKKIKGFYPIGYSYFLEENKNLFGLNLWGKDIGSHKIANIGLAFSVNSGKSTGFQSSFISNINKDAFTGFQLSLANISNELKGVQLAAYNQSESFKGLQIGLINKTVKGHGVQIGLINISDELHGVPLGLIDIQKNGENYYNIWFEGNDAGGFVYTSFRFGSKYFYKQITVGSGRVKSDDVYNGSIAFDLGLRLPLFDNVGSILNDIGAEYLSNNGLEDNEPYSYLVPKLSNKLEIKLTDRLGVIGGITTRVYVDDFNEVVKDSSAYSYISLFGDCFLSHRFSIGLEFK